MTILLASNGMDPAAWAAALQAAAPHHPVIKQADWRGEAIDYVVAWNADPAIYSDLQEVDVVFSLGAGVDHLLQYVDQLPPCPIVRIADPDLTNRMSEWVVLQVLFHHRQSFDYLEQQHRQDWVERDQPAASDVTIGILGMGTLGHDAATKLALLGFKVCGWSRTAKPDLDIRHFAGGDDLPAFLATSDMLVNLLPSTPATRHLVDYQMVHKLRRGRFDHCPVYINAGRGATQNADGIVRALEDGTLKGASIDVFETEPLPADHSLWQHPRVIITPHMAASSAPGPLSRYIATQIETFESGGALKNVVDFDRGY